METLIVMGFLDERREERVCLVHALCVWKRVGLEGWGLWRNGIGLGGARMGLRILEVWF